ncbi:hypothetical protein [Paenarthrobacter ureafaciens]|uniref:hypothetical protein n=1 Tax=Paenarthrobacter ureafaciens TaxID=37931 RepID=UPI001C2C7A0B|nr:hypothetical protein [Paenarthrobacter ureafaciens]
MELISPAASMMSGLDELLDSGSAAYVSLLSGLGDKELRHLSQGMNVSDIRGVLNQLRSFQQMNRTERRNLPAAELAGNESLANYFNELFADHGTQPIEKQLLDAGHPEIDEALSSGLLSINHSVTNGLITGAPEDLGKVYGEMLQGVLDRGNALLLDEEMSLIVRRMIEEGMIEESPTGVARSVKAGTGTGLIARLPAFPAASVGRVLDARAQLDEPLGRYRRAVKDYSQKLKSAPFSTSLEHELDDLWLEEVQPSVVDLQRRVGGAAIARETLWEGFSVAKPLVAETAAALIHFQGPNIGLNEVVTTATAVTTAAAGFAPPVVKSLRAANEAKKSDLYYLAALGKALDPR